MRNVCFRVAVAVFLLGARGLAAQAPLDSTSVGTWLDSVFPRALKEGDIAGAVVVVVKDGKVLLGRGYGFADVGRRVAMDPDRTVIPVGSVSKLFTWTAVMQQVQRKKLQLDRDINDYLDFPIPPAFGKPIELRHLMTHSAGFEERAFRTYAVPRKLREHLKGTPVPERIYPPGEVVAYSNYGSMLGGYMVELVSGEPFVDYIERHIFQPLGMQHSSFRRPPPAALAGDLARSYPQATGKPDPLDALDHEEPSGDPSGHLTTTGSDIARFMIAHLQRGRFGDVELLAPEVADLMQAPAMEPIPGGNPITLGFFRRDRNGQRIIGHGGDIESFHADVVLLPDVNVGYFMVLNSDGAPRGLFGAAHLFRASFFGQFIDRHFPGPAPSEQPTAPTAQEHARLLAGEYQMSRRGVGDFAELEMLLARSSMRLRITAHGDGTIETPPLLDFERGQPRKWREVGPFVWREVGGDGWLDVQVENGRVKALLPRDLYSFVLQPIAWTKSARGNVALLFGASLVLVLAVVLWPVTAIFERRSAGKIRPEWKSLRMAALVGVAYLLAWAALLGFDMTTREGAEVWIRLAQLVGVAALVGTAFSLRSAWLIARARPGWAQVAASVLVALAMLELVWLSFGFHLLSIRLIY